MIIHHGRKIALDVNAPAEFPVLDETAKAAELLIRLGQSDTATLTEAGGGRCCAGRSSQPAFRTAPLFGDSWKPAVDRSGGKRGACPRPDEPCNPEAIPQLQSRHYPPPSLSAPPCLAKRQDVFIAMFGKRSQSASLRCTLVRAMAASLVPERRASALPERSAIWRCYGRQKMTDHPAETQRTRG